MESVFKIDETLARRVIRTVDRGLTKGKGSPAPGHMCVEAAVCYAMGLDHSDEPPCVSPEIQDLKITVNDAYGVWKSKADRARGLRAIAVAQLGTAYHVSGKNFPTEFMRRARKLDEKFGLTDDVVYQTSAWWFYDRFYTIDATRRREFTLAVIDQAVFALKKLRSPGSKYLYLLDEIEAR